tara:strand:+ start:3867 stop:6203 length:2337 start_codon:yes stop_codon:yes gene_type:complete
MKFVLYEKYDRINMAKLLCIDDTDIIDGAYKASLTKYKHFGKNGIVAVEYERVDIGRLKIKVKGLKEGETCICQPYMWCNVKGDLCNNIYTDVDIVNCHPIIFQQLCKKENLSCPKLKNYNQNREILFQTLMKKYSITRNCLKKQVMKLMYGNEECFKNIELCDEIKDLHKEMEKCKKIILGSEKYSKYMVAANEKKGSDYFNLTGTALSYILQTIECDLLMTMKTWFETNGFTIGALIHDGLHIEKNEKLLITDTHLNTLKKYIFDKTKWMVDVKQKDFEIDDKLHDIYVVEDDAEGGAIFTDMMKHNYIECDNRVFVKHNDLWTENSKTIQQKLIDECGSMDIKKFNKDGDITAYSRNKSGCNNILHFTKPTQDLDFINKLWESNIGKICYRNGYYDFKLKCLCEYDEDTYTTIKINRDFKKADKDVKKLVYDKVFNPIFNKDEEMMKCYLNYIARGLFGHIEDKNWSICMGERNSGKGVIGGALENAFGKYVLTTNGENLMYKNGNSGDAAKNNSWMVNTEFSRLILTNELTIDSEGKHKINGNIVKKLTSGGDYIEARQNFKDEINFKSQGRMLIFCNDLPPIEPSDCKETAFMFNFPSKFVDKNDPLLNVENSVKVYDDLGNVVKDENGDILTRCITHFYEKDDNIKSWLKEDKVIDAFTEIILEHYGEKVNMSIEMLEDQSDFQDDETEEVKFMELFIFPDDKEWNNIHNTDKDEYVFISTINRLITEKGLPISPQKYGKWLKKRGCIKRGTEGDSQGKHKKVWRNIKLGLI